MQTASSTKNHDDDSGIGDDTGIDIDTLPNELLGLIFSFLPCVRRRVAAMVSVRWSAVAMPRNTAAGPLCCCPVRYYSTTICVIKAAASEGHVVCLSYMLSRHGRYDGVYGHKRKAARAAARRGRLACLDYMAAQRGGIDASALDAAAKAGNADAIRYLCERAGQVAHWGHLSRAIASGSVDAVDYLYARSPDMWTHEEWFDGKGRAYKDIYDRCRGQMDAYACAIAARHGRIRALAHLVNVGCRPDANACIEAARAGHLNCLKYAREQGAPWDERTCAAAAIGLKGDADQNIEGRLECIVYARANGCPANNTPCYMAAARGDLDGLRQAREAGCPWDACVTVAAAGGGHRACLYYAHQQGCEWSKRVCVLAAARGALKILTYAHRHGCPYDFDDLVRAATRGGQRWCLDYIQKYMQ
ncbi:ankyrin repeat protein [Pandoravirus inopinatum]|uniref:Ankyrin repeat protein n=1 Tax=Pandoravirus inopinatum TaxID=1605721 RepID=A0A0B5JD53_9VIRU|nr:ankyrin repeat protein [Pandoravirus inopinatum]AJF97612.1 ankyrin repeat protein [Pandoravirus inopinatum]